MRESSARDHATLIDDGLAWSLVRAVAPLADQPSGHRAGVQNARTGVETWLAVDASGSWETSHPLGEGAAAVFDLYLPLVLAERVVIGQLGQSLDGRIATETGASHFVTGPEDITRLHRVRALVDAVVVGTHTVAQDDPRLTVRRVAGENPVRVVLDPKGRLSADRKVFTDGAAETLVVGPGGLEVPLGEDGALDPGALLDELRTLGLNRILVEGGGITVSRFVAAGLLDRLHVTVAPLLIGSGRPSLTLDPIETLDGALRPACRTFHLGNDVLFDFDFTKSGPSASDPR